MRVPQSIMNLHGNMFSTNSILGSILLYSCRGKDVDLLELLVTLTPFVQNVIFLKLARGNKEGKEVFCSLKIQETYPCVQKYLLFLHAFSIVVTQLAQFSQRQSILYGSFIKMRMTYMCSKRTATKDEIVRIGCKIMLLLYSATKYTYA